MTWGRRECFPRRENNMCKALEAESSLSYFKEPQVVSNDCFEGVWGGQVGGSEACVKVGEQRNRGGQSESI